MIHFATDLRGKVPVPFRHGKKGTYYIRQYLNGRDVWRSLHTTVRREAEYIAAEIWREQQSGTVQSIIPAPPLPLNLVWERYTKTDKYKLLAASTQHSKSVVWAVFAKWCEAQNLKLSADVTLMRAREYLDGMPVRNKTYNNVLNDLRMVFAAADRNPFEKIEPKSTIRGAEDKRSTRINAFSDDEAALILDRIRSSRQLSHADERVDLCRMLDNTGLRYKDAALLKYESVQMIGERRCLVLAPHKTEMRTGGKVVIINLTPEAADIIDRRNLRSGGQFVFPALADEYERRGNSAANWLDKIFKRCGIASSAHGYRVRLVTKAAKAGVDLGDFGGVVGHTTEGQTKAYNRAAESIDLAPIVAQKL